MCKTGTRDLDPMVGFGRDSYKVAQDEHLTAEHFSSESTILSIDILCLN